MTAKARSSKSEALAPTNTFERVDLANLLLDANNPRLGACAGQLSDQTAIVDAIVDVFGVDNVLSSLPRQQNLWVHFGSGSLPSW